MKNFWRMGGGKNWSEFDWHQFWAWQQKWWQQSASYLRLRVRTLPIMRIIMMLGIGAWLASGFYLVDAGERGVVTRFFAYHRTVEPGAHWHWPAPIEQITKVNVERQQFIEIGYRSSQGQPMPLAGEARMLTRDENIVDLRLAIQYRIKEPAEYLFSLQDPDRILRQTAESVTRGIVGQQKMNEVLTEGRGEIVSRIERELQQNLDKYQSGIEVLGVNLQDVQPPEEVQQAFADAIKAREDRERLINEAQAYANEVLPKARGAAARIVSEAEAYQQSVLVKAEGEADRFRTLLAEYRKQPEITRRRLAIETMEEVLTRTDSVLVSLGEGSKLVYLPVDKLKVPQAETLSSLIPETPAESKPEPKARTIAARIRPGRGG